MRVSLLSWMTSPVLALAVAQPSMAASHLHNGWKVGEEREIVSGRYAKLLTVVSGWRVWRFETRGSVDCEAIKSPMGSAIVPLPTGEQTYFGGSPSVHMVGSDNRPTIELIGKYRSYPNETLEIRRVGEKFWTDANKFDWLSADAVEVQVHAVTWEYPAILAGMADETAIIDLTGLDVALSQVDLCVKRGRNE